MTEADKLLREAKKIMSASSARTLNKDFLQRVNDYFRRQEASKGPAPVVSLQADGPSPLVSKAVPIGYWQGAYSADGGATLYEVPQESAFGRRYPNFPLFARALPPSPNSDDIEAGAEALVDSCIAKGHWAHCSDESKEVYRQHAKAVLDAFVEGL